MNERDEALRNTITDTLTQMSIDSRNLAVEVVDGVVILKGTVGSEESLRRLQKVLAGGKFGSRPIQCDVGVMAALPSDSLDGRGRSPATGTSADSAHESRHQLDKT
jgi:hypothetical protein